MAKYSGDPIGKARQRTVCNNCTADFLQRGLGRIEAIEKHINGSSGSFSINLFKVIGELQIISHWCEIGSVTTLANCTSCYISLYDGTLETSITSNGSTLSGYTEGSFMIKDLNNVNPYTILKNDQGRVFETTSKKIHEPFFILQKKDTDTFVRFNYTTTDAPVDFYITFYFEWKPLDHSDLEVV